MNQTERHVFVKLQTFLADWGFSSIDWIVGLNEALKNGGYDVGYKRKGHLHIVVDRANIPWVIPPEQKNFPDLMPPTDSPFSKACLQFTAQTGFDFSILAFTSKQFKMLKKNSVQLALTKTRAILILTPLGVLKIEGLVWNTFLLHSPEKLQRIMALYYKLLALAKKKRDRIIVAETTKLLTRFEKKIKKVIKNVAPQDFKGTLAGTIGYPGKVIGRVWLIVNRDAVPRKRTGNILVAQMTSEKMTPYFKQLKALVTDEGGSLCHAAIIARELKLPCVIGTQIATKVFKDGDLVEVDAEKGTIRKLG